MNREELGCIQYIHQMSFAAKKQIDSWENRGDSADIGGLKATFERIIKRCEEQLNKRSEAARSSASAQAITHITVVPDSKSLFDYQRGDIGYHVTNVASWMLCCPGCGHMSIIYPKDKIIKNDDGTVSAREPLYCHGSKMRQRYSIEHNEVKWL